MTPPAVAICPACHRPVAMARPTCLYCGRPLPKDVVAAVTATAENLPVAPLPRGLLTRASPPDAPGEERRLLVVDTTGAEVEHLRALLGLGALEATLRARAGGFHLHRAGTPEEVEAEATRLAQAGLRALSVPEADARRPPLRALHGERERGGLRLRARAGTFFEVRDLDVELVVEGPIHREYQAREVARNKPRLGALDPGYCIHLHRRSDPRPVELDPSEFSFGPHGTITGSSLLEMKSWIEALGAVARDDAFKRLPVALAPAAPAEGAHTSLSGAARGALGRPKDAVPILDNLAQFRFWSGWRAAVHRRLASDRGPDGR